MILTMDQYIAAAELPAQLTRAVEFPKYCDDLRIAMASYEREHIRRVLLATGGNKERSARQLGINPSTLYRKMADLGLASESSS
jgi:transcriptional regulator with PAS, ATPase and Fis domain